jgi:hypothetical protein
MGAMLIGTSGYDYSEWKGRFYPEKLARFKIGSPCFLGGFLGILYSIGKKEKRNIFSTNNYE